MNTPLDLPQLLIIILLLLPRRNILSGAADGKWDLLHSNIGITAMHMQLLHTDRVVIFDRTDFGLSNISLPHGKCRDDPNEKIVKHDCTAHSVEYNVASNSIRPLMVQTDVWCSSGAVTPDGTLVQTGGFRDGEHVVRTFRPCTDDYCDWVENGGGLSVKRWYATNHILPDGRSIVFGGRDMFNYEFYPKRRGADKVYQSPFLRQTNDPGSENNLYPFVFLNADGNLFIFANNRAILFNYNNGAVIKNYPPIPGGDPRSYPSTGSAVLLPLEKYGTTEVLVCGGSPRGAFTRAKHGTFVGALNTCGRIGINDPNPRWAMETMPMGRVMGDMVLLPNGEVLIVNGGGSGTAGWEYGRDPVLSPVIYRPYNRVGTRFVVQTPSTRPRMYHSTAILLRDGRVLVGGSNPHEFYRFTGVLFPTDLTLEAFSPPYALVPRPNILSPASQSKMSHGQPVNVRFALPPDRRLDQSSVMVTMVAPSFTTHSFAMNQRLLVLSGGNVVTIGGNTHEIQVTAPGSLNLAPSGYYLLFVCHQGIPSEGIWVQIT
ncbi:galactose oxidase-like [Dorcoceras hygrometricum]|uniref:Aldehyde oxidase GLOX n=1 Tax=Dorcoceras hygrometricum TaxID=472368 RepID=A0A2Z7CHY1_9LAMI|nr:galactose oxidase-like [Dorcoceras hygrometricum]